MKKTIIASIMLIGLLASCQKQQPSNNCTIVVDKHYTYDVVDSSSEYWIKYQEEGTNHIYSIPTTQQDYDNTIVGTKTCN